MKRFRDKIVNFCSSSPTDLFKLRHPHFLHYHWPVKRKAVRKLSMMSIFKNHGNWQRSEARSDKENQYH